MNNELSYRLSDSMTAFCRANMNRKANLPVSSSEMGMLIYITLNAGDTGVKAVELSEYFGIKKASVSSTIASLEKQGYIRRILSEKDKRSTPLFPDEKGAKLVKEAFNEYHRFTDRIIEKLGRSKCEEFLSMLDTATKIIQNGDVE